MKVHSMNSPRVAPDSGYLRQCGVDVCYEVRPGEDLCDGASFEMFLDRVRQHARANLLYDPSHFVSTTGYLSYIDIYHERVGAFHVKDPSPANRAAGVSGGFQAWKDRAGRSLSSVTASDFKAISASSHNTATQDGACSKWGRCLEGFGAGCCRGIPIIRNNLVTGRLAHIRQLRHHVPMTLPIAAYSIPDGRLTACSSMVKNYYAGSRPEPPPRQTGRLYSREVPMQSVQEIQQSFAGLKLRAPQVHLNLALFPLIGEAEHCSRLLASRRGAGRELARVAEVSTDGHVPELAFENGSNEKILLVDGDELVGARQNRILNLTILVGGGQKLVIPVSCVEQGRWSYRGSEFRSGRRTLFAKARAAKMRQVTESLVARGDRTRRRCGRPSQTKPRSAKWIRRPLR